MEGEGRDAPRRKLIALRTSMSGVEACAIMIVHNCSKLHQFDAHRRSYEGTHVLAVNLETRRQRRTIYPALPHQSSIAHLLSQSSDPHSRSFILPQYT